jgi:hypothetical protein
MVATFSQLGRYGRMGNAMFQIATTIGYAKMYGEDFQFPYWEYCKYYNLPLEKFGCNIKVSNKYDEKRFSYDLIPHIQNCDLSGYFQSWKYFSHCEDYIREIFTPKKYENPAMFRSMCAVHVRRGDYNNLPDYHPVLGMDYYNEAMSRISATKFLIFSDDPVWCKCNFKGSKCVVTELGDVVTDLSMMMACENQIIANSSFSWWAAWLNSNKNKLVVAPRKWFGPKLAFDHPTDDLIPENWIRI